MITITVISYMGGDGNSELTYEDVAKYSFTDDFLIIENEEGFSKHISYIPKEQILYMEVFK